MSVMVVLGCTGSDNTAINLGSFLAPLKNANFAGIIAICYFKDKYILQC